MEGLGEKKENFFLEKFFWGESEVEVMEEIEEVKEKIKNGENGGIGLADRSPTICYFNFLNRVSCASPAVDGARRGSPKPNFLLSYLFSFPFGMQTRRYLELKNTFFPSICSIVEIFRAYFLSSSM